ncbi:MAG: hypothetical protein R8M45_07490 [Ghiorsea sp.]
MMAQVMAYSDLVKLLAFGVALMSMYRFTIKVTQHVATIKGSANRVRERIHLYSHLWVVASGLFAALAVFSIQGVHIYYQNVVHDDSMVTILEVIMNYALAWFAVGYAVAINHLSHEETAGTSVSYYGDRKHSSRKSD